ncbi:YchJ family metal-binding protein [Serratia microhaemolytica]|uniref:YchJ family metal-binding protein n=1 Tax=Serratia microhaemolytica TaxID=2675110 RepID=UPI000FDECCE5|nr:YchJ family metal-binding protein [Serratia microhaemolytica]
MTELCPCHSGLNYSDCCEPFLTGKQHAPSPGKLMRSRYSAFVQKNVDYFIDTWHPECRPEEWRGVISSSFDNTQLLSLLVVEESFGSSANEGFVEFMVRLIENDAPARLMHERSRFLRVGERWYYIDGTKPQLGKHALCPCGSGKKYRKCCGQ